MPLDAPMISPQVDGFCLQTKRLILRPWRTEDLAGFLPIVQDPQVMRLIGPGHTWDADAAAAFIARQIDFQNRFGFCLWALESIEDRALIGFCGGRPTEAALAASSSDAAGGQEVPAPAGPPEVEIGWRLAQAYWGKGLATEAAMLAVEYLFGTLGVPRVIAITRAENERSIRVMQKLGMQFHSTRLRDGHPIVQYALVADERRFG
jgi:RimJ/RimL family protein N-acetyltransferase